MKMLPESYGAFCYDSIKQARVLKDAGSPASHSYQQDISSGLLVKCLTIFCMEADLRGFRL